MPLRSAARLRRAMRLRRHAHTPIFLVMLLDAARHMLAVEVATPLMLLAAAAAVFMIISLVCCRCRHDGAMLPLAAIAAAYYCLLPPLLMLRRFLPRHTLDFSLSPAFIDYACFAFRRAVSMLIRVARRRHACRFAGADDAFSAFAGLRRFSFAAAAAGFVATPILILSLPPLFFRHRPFILRATRKRIMPFFAMMRRRC